MFKYILYICLYTYIYIYIQHSSFCLLSHERTMTRENFPVDPRESARTPVRIVVTRDITFPGNKYNSRRRPREHQRRSHSRDPVRLHRSSGTSAHVGFRGSLATLRKIRCRCRNPPPLYSPEPPINRRKYIRGTTR